MAVTAYTVIDHAYSTRSLVREANKLPAQQAAFACLRSLAFAFICWTPSGNATLGLLVQRARSLYDRTICTACVAERCVALRQRHHHRRIRSRVPRLCMRSARAATRAAADPRACFLAPIAQIPWASWRRTRTLRLRSAARAPRHPSNAKLMRRPDRVVVYGWSSLS